MVELSRIYTKGGDRGKTSLSTGTRVAKYDLRVDAYALGATLHEALSGIPAGRWRPGRPRPPLARLGSAVPLALSWIVDRLLLLDPAARPTADDATVARAARATRTGATARRARARRPHRRGGGGRPGGADPASVGGADAHASAG